MSRHAGDDTAECRYQVEPDPAEMGERYGPETPVPDWRERLVCSRCGSRRRRLALSGSHEIDMVVTGTEGR
jgi:hypothetical protein